MTLEKVKSYLRVDYDDDDSIITTMMHAAEEYIVGAVGVYDSSSEKANLLFLAIVQELYDHREMTVTEQQRKRISYVFGSIILQLRLEQEGG